MPVGEGAVGKMTEMRRVWLAAFCYWTVASLLVWCFCPALKGDGIARYIPMADAFARGEWKLAYHPRYGVFFSTLAGLVCRFTPLDGMKACQTTAFFLLSLSGVATWWFVRRVFDSAKAAWISFFLVLLVIEYIWPSVEGYRDSGRILGLALVACGMLGARSAVLGAGIFVLATVRADTWLIATAFTGVLAMMQILNRQWKNMVLPLCGWLLGTACMVTLTWLFFGYWLPSTQYVNQYLKYFGS